MMAEGERNEKRLEEIGGARFKEFVPPSPLCMENARIFLEHLSGRLEPDVYPTPDGGLSFEWENTFFDACFETGPDGGSGEFSIMFTDETPDVSFETSLAGGGSERIVAELRKAFEAYGLLGGGHRR